jgi:hypothetical protein
VDTPVEQAQVQAQQTQAQQTQPVAQQTPVPEEPKKATVTKLKRVLKLKK